MRQSYIVRPAMRISNSEPEHGLSLHCMPSPRSETIFPRAFLDVKIKHKSGIPKKPTTNATTCCVYYKIVSFHFLRTSFATSEYKCIFCPRSIVLPFCVILLYMCINLQAYGVLCYFGMLRLIAEASTPNVNQRCVTLYTFRHV